MSQPGLFDPPEATPPKNLVRDPAVAAAIAKCIVATLDQFSRLAYMAHPAPCRFCNFPLARRLDALLEFNTWAGWAALDKPPHVTDPDWPALEPTVEAFMALPREEQLSLTAKAAGYVSDIFTKDTGYQYSGRQTERRRKYGEDIRKYGEVSESVIADKKATGSGGPETTHGDVGGRDRSGNRAGRGVGGPETPARAARRGLPDPETEAPGPDQGDLPIPPRDSHPNLPF